MDKVAFLYTGQGMQYPGMLGDLPQTERTQQLLNQAMHLVGCSDSAWDTPENLQHTQYVQLSIFLSEYILSQHVLAQGYEPAFVFGHSVGAFAAAAAAGALSFTDGLHLVSLRGSMMEAAYPRGYGMLAVDGLSQHLLAEFLQTNEKDVYLANSNAPTQMILSGALEALQRFSQSLKELYPVKTMFLNITVPSHCALLHPVAFALQQEMQQISFLNPSIAYIMNTTGRRTKKAMDIRKDLGQGVSHLVRWYEGIRLLCELGVEVFVEMSQASTLCQLGRSCFPEKRWVSWGEWGENNVSLLLSACI